MNGGISGGHYAAPSIKLTAAQAKEAAVKEKPSYFHLGTAWTAAKPTKTALVWGVPRVDASGNSVPFDWNGTAQVVYRVWFGRDYIDVDAETGKLMAASTFK